MRTVTIHIVRCLLGLMFVSCEQYEDVDIEIPHTPKLVVSCFLQAQTNEMRVNITRSQPYFGEVPGEYTTPIYITDASVEITEGQNTYVPTYDSIQKQYIYVLPISSIDAGKTYTIKVTGDGKQLTGSTRIPTTANTHITYTFDSILMAEGSYQYRTTLTCTLLDAEPKNIQLFPLMVYSDSTRYPMYLEGFGYNRTERLQTGGSMSRTFLSAFSSPLIHAVGLEVIVLTADEGYARNETHVFESMLSGAGSGSIFAEPAITYSNMKGNEGIGVTGSFNASNTYRINFK